MPALLTLEEQTTPSAPATDMHGLFVDVADGHLKRIDELGTVVDLESAAGHASSHIATGSDPIDGDLVELNRSATNYTPNGNTVGGHLSGIDIILGSAIAKTLNRREIAAADTLVLGDNSKNVVATSGGFALNFDNAMTLGTGWYCYTSNDGAGVVTMRPSNGQLLDNNSAITLQTGVSRVVCCSGLGFYTLPLQQQLVDTQIFTISGTWTKHPWAKTCIIDLVGGGGKGADGTAGAAGTNRFGGGGGGGGARNILSILTNEVSNTEVVTVGSWAGNTSFGTRLYAYGGASASGTVAGAGGGQQSAGTAGGSGGLPTLGVASYGGSYGGSGVVAGGATIRLSAGYGGGGGATGRNAAGTAGGHSLFGGGGGASGAGHTSTGVTAAAAGGATNGDLTNGGLAGNGIPGGSGVNGNYFFSGSGGGSPTNLNNGGGRDGGPGGVPGGGGGGGSSGTAAGEGAYGGRGEARIWGFG